MSQEAIFNDLKEVITLIRPNIDLAKITPESDLFTDLGMDSLMMMLVALAIENKFKIQISTGQKFQKVSDVIDYISKNYSE